MSSASRAAREVVEVEEEEVDELEAALDGVFDAFAFVDPGKEIQESREG